MTAEASGFDIVSISDSQSLYRDVYVSLTLCALHTRRIRFGSRVITPLTRHPAVAAAATLEELAPARTMIGIGTGDSAAYMLDLKPASRAQFREYALTMRGLLTRGTAENRGGRRA